METVPWRRFREVGGIREELEHIWGRYFTEPLSPRLKPNEWVPPADIAETKSHVFFAVELPGVDAKDLAIHLEGDILTFKGEKGKPFVPESHAYSTCEIYCGAFQCSYRLPARVEAEEAAARFNNGILTLKIPKGIDSGRRRIEVKIAQ